MSKTHFSMLFNTYGSLLTEKQQSVAELYFDCDCSLAEIASEVGISRQGVRDALVKAENALNNFEEKLGLCKQNQRVNQFTSDLQQALQQQDLEKALALLDQFNLEA
ncbi:MAG: hypothetical protein J6R37_03100 [Clostridia bacterium]|nr:hypothetical protein [Clostridia bacterium]